jgi:Fur family ferric uptake transcriptional regulator
MTGSHEHGAAQAGDDGHAHTHEHPHDPAAPAEPTDWRARLRGKGYRLTPQRELILDAVDTLGHSTPDEVLAEVRKSSSALNISTVYRTLEVLEELGLVRHAHLSDRAPTYHSVGDHAHFHLVCRNCRKVISVAPDVLDPVLVRLRDEFAFEADVGHLTVFGRCLDCPADDEGAP